MTGWGALIWTTCRRGLKAFAANRRGGFVTTFALALPVVAVLSCGAIDLSSVSSARNKMQEVADAAALEGARQLSVANSQGVGARAQAFAMDQLSGLAQSVTLTPTVTVASDNSQITVAIHGHRMSFFGNLLPVGGWNFDASATAASVGRMPLCVLTTSSTDATGAINMLGQSKTTAAGCLVHSNADLTLSSAAFLLAGTAEATGTATGPITPQPQTGAPKIGDPFAGLSLAQPPGGCDILPDLLHNLLGIIPIAPGVHCGAITVDKNLTVYLEPGVHYFKNSKLVIQNNATLQGSNVVLIFDDQSSFVFQDHSQIKLQGRQSGTLAGFVIATTPNNTNTFVISSDAARLLLGTIYAPNAVLSVSGGSNNVADQSAWTVIVAKGLKLDGSPNLVINSAYTGSGVPTPAGVGPSGQGARLIH
jgi:Flp pilus assembly protein TadG